MTFDLPNESCAGQREEVPDKGYSTGYFTYGSVNDFLRTPAPSPTELVSIHGTKRFPIMERLTASIWWSSRTCEEQIPHNIVPLYAF
jgi:hypothetical protein